jgi:hypothetical protein
LLISSDAPVVVIAKAAVTDRVRYKMGAAFKESAQNVILGVVML